MDTTLYKVEIELLEDMLGTIPKSKEIFKKFVASKCADAGLAEAEVDTVEDIEERGWTGFHRDAQGYLLKSYVVKGFLCEAARTLKQYGAMKQLSDKFKRYVFVSPTNIRLPDIDKEPLERPLRAQTAQGPRVCLARSDKIPAGTKLSFTVEVVEVGGVTENCLKEVLSYGRLMGLGQWRSGGFGRFKVLSVEEC